MSHLPIKSVARIYGPIEESFAKFQDQLIGVLNPFMKMVINELHLIDRLKDPPTLMTSSGSKGDYAFKLVSGTWYLYMCVDTNTWRRVALGTF